MLLLEKFSLLLKIASNFSPAVNLDIYDSESDIDLSLELDEDEEDDDEEDVEYPVVPVYPVDPVPESDGVLYSIFTYEILER